MTMDLYELIAGIKAGSTIGVPDAGPVFNQNPPLHTPGTYTLK